MSCPVANYRTGRAAFALVYLAQQELTAFRHRHLT